MKARTGDVNERKNLLVIDFDASACQDRLLVLEAARIRRVRTEHLVLEVEDCNNLPSLSFQPHFSTSGKPTAGCSHIREDSGTRRSERFAPLG